MKCGKRLTLTTRAIAWLTEHNVTVDSMMGDNEPAQ
jgi:hypothetical protein